MGEAENQVPPPSRGWHPLKDYTILVTVGASAAVAAAVFSGILLYQAVTHEEQTPGERTAQRIADCRQEHNLPDAWVMPDELPGVARGCTWPPAGGLDDGYYELHIELVYLEDSAMVDADTKAYIVTQAPCERLEFRSSYHRGGFDPSDVYPVRRGDVASLDTGELARIPEPLSDEVPVLGAQSVAIIGGGAYELMSLICLPPNS